MSNWHHVRASRFLRRHLIVCIPCPVCSHRGWWCAWPTKRLLTKGHSKLSDCYLSKAAAAWLPALDVPESLSVSVIVFLSHSHPLYSTYIICCQWSCSCCFVNKLCVETLPLCSNIVFYEINKKSIQSHGANTTYIGLEWQVCVWLGVAASVFAKHTSLCIKWLCAVCVEVQKGDWLIHHLQTS